MTESDAESFREPSFTSRALPQAFQLRLYLPGINPDLVEITTRGPALSITAPRRRDRSQRRANSRPDTYQLHLRLGLRFDNRSLVAELSGDTLILTIPKRQGSLRNGHSSHRQVA